MGNNKIQKKLNWFSLIQRDLLRNKILNDFKDNLYNEIINAKGQKVLTIKQVLEKTLKENGI